MAAFDQGRMKFTRPLFRLLTLNICYVAWIIQAIKDSLVFVKVKIKEWKLSIIKHLAVCLLKGIVNQKFKI